MIVCALSRFCHADPLLLTLESQCATLLLFSVIDFTMLQSVAVLNVTRLHYFSIDGEHSSILKYSQETIKLKHRHQ